MNFAVVMAGGIGKRLWPLSRKSRPKQILKIIAGQSLIQQCVERLLPIFDNRNIIILTNAAYVDLVREAVTQVPKENVIAEPAVRDTAGAIGLAAAVLSKFDANATMAVVTADQIIEPTETFQSVMTDAIAYINDNPDELFTFGIKPTFPSTQLGYIKYSEQRQYPNCKNKILTVEEFKEKPALKIAEQYLKSGAYLWNSGMFVWKAKTILQKLADFLPDSTEPLAKIKADWDSPSQNQTLLEWFPKFPKISIDFAVMEKAKSVKAIELDCRWHDMGSFAALADIINADENNNIISAHCTEMLNCKNSIVVTEDKGHLIAGIGLDNMVIAHTADATLICPVDETQKLKELLALIEKHKGDKYL